MSAGRNKSLGEAVSYLATLGIENASPPQPEDHDGLVLLVSPPGHVITDEMVENAMLDE